MISRFLRRLPALVGLLTLVASCSTDPVAASRAFVVKGDRYAAEGRLRAAVLEYRNAIDQYPSDAATHLKLAEAYDKLGDRAKALDEYIAVTKLDERHIAANLRVGTALNASQRYEDAERVLARSLRVEPAHAGTLTALAAALDGLGRRTEAHKRLDEALAANPQLAEAYVLQGRWAARDKRGPEAEAAFRKAVSLAPQYGDGWTGLGTYLWAARQLPEAEHALQTALSVSDDKSGPQRTLATFYIASGRAADAERHLQQLAEASPAGRLMLADYYLGLDRIESAEPILAGLLEEPRLAGEARLRRATLFHATNRQKDADAEIDAALKDASVEARARVIRSAWRVQQGDVDGALDDARGAARLQPRSAAASYAIGVAALAKGELSEAEREFKRAGDLAPDSYGYLVQLAQIALMKGDLTEAARHAKQLTDSAPSPAAGVLLARTQRLQGDLSAARRTLVRARQQWPELVELETEFGFFQLASKQPAAARKTFERSLQLAPSPANRYGWVAAHVAIGSPDVARESIAEWRTREPDDLQLALLAAQLDLAEGKVAAAIQAYEAIAARQEKPVNALLMLGLLHEKSGNHTAATRAYEQVLALDDRQGVAANNLAGLLAKAGRLEEAIATAERAATLLDGVVQAQDTLGWIYFQAGRPSDAMRHLTRARDKAPGNPTYHYHVAAVYAATGEPEKARASARRAIALKTPFPEEAEARALAEARAD